MNEHGLQPNTLQPVLQQLARIARHVSQLGWSVGHSGNASILLADTAADQITANTLRSWRHPVTLDGFTGRLILITKAGSRFRDIVVDARAGVTLLRIDRPGDLITQLSDNPNEDGWPTSELAAHLHAYKALARQRIEECALLHLHPPELVALTLDPYLTSEQVFNDEVLSLYPEATLMFPRGVGMLPYMPPGSEQLALASAKALAPHGIVVWCKHGVIAGGRTLDEALDRIEALNTAAKLLLHCRQAGFEPQGLTAAEAAELRSWALKEGSQRN